MFDKRFLLSLERVDILSKFDVDDAIKIDLREYDLIFVSSKIMNYYNFFKKTDLKTMWNFDFKICDRHCTLHHCDNECLNASEKSGSEL